MKLNLRNLAAGFLLALPASAFSQAVPTTPTKFSTKPVGSATGTTGASISPPATKPMVRQVTYLTLSPLRQWNSTDGNSRMGKLIAWEETVTTTTGSPPVAPFNPITTKPTVIKENKAYEVPVERFGAEERKFIQDLQTAILAKP